MHEPVHVIGVLYLWIAGAILVIPFWRIFGKAGFSGLLSRLMLVPVLNLLLLFALAFIEWPVERELAGLRKP